MLIEAKLIDTPKDVLPNKTIFVKEQLPTIPRLIVYTYDAKSFLSVSNLASKTILIGQIRSIKQLDEELEQFYINEAYRTCNIVLEYATLVRTVI